MTRAAAVAILFSISPLLPVMAQQQEPAAFSHLALHVRELEKSAAFYERVLNLRRMPDPFRDAAHVWFRLGASGQLHLIAGGTELPKQDMDVHLAFSVPSIEEFCRLLDAAKIPFVNARSQPRQVTVRPDGVKQVYFQDPDGYWIEVNDERV